MTFSNAALRKNIKQFSSLFIEQFQKIHNQLPAVENDSEWPSPCITSPLDDKYSFWKPVEIAESLSFANVESALDIEIHPDLKNYFTTIYSDSIDAKSKDGNLSLLFAWSKKDFDRLQENLIGHVLMKRKLKQAVTFFFAVTDEEDMILSVVNETGEVWVERVGKEPHKKIADSLGEFINDIEPFIIQEET